MAKTQDISVYFLTNAILAPCHTRYDLKLKLGWFPNKVRNLAAELSTDKNLVPLMPDGDKTFSGSLVLDLRI